MPTKIPWSDENWPVVTGCTPTSEGCTNCYGARMAATRLRDHPRYEGLAVMHNGKPRWTGKVNLNYDVLDQPLHFRKPRMIFVASMGDLFHPSVPEDFIWRVIDIAYTAQQHLFQILTKRPERMLDVLTRSAWWNNDTPGNIWLGTSIENQATADERIPWLLQAPAAVRFVSCEPLLAGIRIGQYLEPGWSSKFGMHDGLNWVIAGSESGPGARPMDEDWVRDLRDQCQAANVKFFYKQKMVGGHRVHMPELDGRIWGEFPVSVSG